MNDEERTDASCLHFHKVLNRNVSGNMDFIQSIPKVNKLYETSGGISMLELENYSSQLTWHEAPGLNGVSPKSAKALDCEHRVELYNSIDSWSNDVSVKYAA